MKRGFIVKIAVLSDKLSTQHKQNIFSDNLFTGISFIDLGEFDTLSTFQGDIHDAEEVILEKFKKYKDECQAQNAMIIIAITVSGNSGQIYANKTGDFIAVSVNSEDALNEALKLKCDFYDLPSSLNTESISNIVNKIIEVLDNTSGYDSYRKGDMG
jgi:hypothetical protein